MRDRIHSPCRKALHEPERRRRRAGAPRREGSPPGRAVFVGRHRLNGYLAHRVPSLFLASSFWNC